jgi:hypothetical protein
MFLNYKVEFFACIMHIRYEQATEKVTIRKCTTVHIRFVSVDYPHSWWHRDILYFKKYSKYSWKIYSWIQLEKCETFLDIRHALQFPSDFLSQYITVLAEYIYFVIKLKISLSYAKWDHQLTSIYPIRRKKTQAKSGRSHMLAVLHVRGFVHFLAKFRSNFD